MSSPALHWINGSSPPSSFPPVECALREPDGLLAAGGDLSSPRLLYAYRHGIFPWYNPGEPILWWSPDPRCVLRPSHVHRSRRLSRTLRHHTGAVTFNRAFENVLAACAEPRGAHVGTWITSDMARAYTDLHRQGWAHSIEVWQGQVLIGGLYGLAVGRVFFGESMFSRETNGSKIALLALCQVLAREHFALLDCQVASPHLLSMGAELMSREAFTACLDEHCDAKRFEIWPGDPISVRDLANQKI